MDPGHQIRRPGRCPAAARFPSMSPVRTASPPTRKRWCSTSRPATPPQRGSSPRITRASWHRTPRTLTTVRDRWWRKPGHRGGRRYRADHHCEHVCGKRADYCRCLGRITTCPGFPTRPAPTGPWYQRGSSTPGLPTGAVAGRQKRRRFLPGRHHRCSGQRRGRRREPDGNAADVVRIHHRLPNRHPEAERLETRTIQRARPSRASPSCRWASNGTVTIANTSSAKSSCHCRRRRLLPAGNADLIGEAFAGIAPQRFLDTRTFRGPVGSAYTVPVQVAGVNGIPNNATGVWVNLTVTEPTAFGYVHGPRLRGAMAGCLQSELRPPADDSEHGLLQPIGEDGKIEIQPILQRVPRAESTHLTSSTSSATTLP